MKFSHAGRLIMTLDFVQDMVANVQLHQVIASVLSPFVVIEARINHVDDTLEQLLYDPLGVRLPRIEEGDIIPKVTITCGKAIIMTIHDNPYWATLQVST